MERFGKLGACASLLLMLLALPRCAPALGPFVLPAYSGRVVDEDTGEPIAGASVIEWYRGAGRIGGPQPSYHARFATSDAQGRFAFERERVWSPRMWLFRTYGPLLGFYHPSYGLETQTPRGEPGGALLLQGSLRRSHLRLDALRPWCAGRMDEDAAAAPLREIACPLEAHAAWPSGVPRAEGEVDAQGRRTGPWTFRYASGGVAARGRYREGGALGDWEFYDRAGRRVGSGSAGAR